MEDERSIGLVLARATDLRLKIGNCVHKATAPRKLEHENGGEEEDDGEEEEAQSLVSICDAIESLETQLSSLQGLQQQQRYEREVALGEIEQSRKSLLEKIKEYKGEPLEVINEATAFAGETVERSSDLLLPPYPARPPNSLRRDSHGFSPHLSLKPVRNGNVSDDQTNGGNKSPERSEKSPRGFGFFLGAAVKTVFAVVGVVSVLSLTGLGPKLASSGKSSVMNLALFRRRPKMGEENEREMRFDCPPGKVLVVENGEARCLVKERVEVPFSSAAAKPDVNYGCG